MALSEVELAQSGAEVPSVASRLRAMLALIRLKPFDQSTEEGRAQERHRRLLLSGASAVLSKGLALFTLIVTTPMAVEGLGRERFGLWTTIISATTVLAVSELGIGSGLITSLARAHGRSDRELSKELVSTALTMFVGLSVLLLAILGLAYPFIPWARLFNLSSELAGAEAGPAVAAFLVCNVLLMPLGIAAQVRSAFQAGFVQSLWTIPGNLLALVAVMVGLKLQVGMPWLVLALSGAPLLTALFGVAALFSWEEPWLRPSLGLVSRRALQQLFGTGAVFFVLELTVLLGQASDNLVVMNVVSPADVTEYSVTMRLFTIVPLGLATIFTPLWPAYGEALSRGDRPWARRTLLRSWGLCVIAVGLSSTVLLMAGQSVVRWWIGPQVVPSSALLAGWAVWSLFWSLGNATAMLMHAGSLLRVHLTLSVAFALVGFAMKVLGGGAFGVAGVVWGTVLAYMVTTALPLSWILWRTLREDRPL